MCFCWFHHSIESAAFMIIDYLIFSMTCLCCSIVFWCGLCRSLLFVVKWYNLFIKWNLNYVETSMSEVSTDRRFLYNLLSVINPLRPSIWFTHLYFVCTVKKIEAKERIEWNKRDLTVSLTTGVPTGGGLRFSNPPKFRVLTKLSRIPCSLENTSVTT
jgi:hypothetical protein